jgi:hypothetical protein
MKYAALTLSVLFLGACAGSESPSDNHSLLTTTDAEAQNETLRFCANSPQDALFDYLPGQFDVYACELSDEHTITCKNGDANGLHIVLSSDNSAHAKGVASWFSAADNSYTAIGTVECGCNTPCTTDLN